MSKLTPFGKALRILRMDKDINLSQMAENLGTTPSFVSGIEVGRRPIPIGYIDKVAQAINATPSEKQTLINAADQSPTVVNVSNIKSNEGRALVGALARKADKLTPEQQATINEILSSLPSLQGQEPFKRKKGHLVSARSYHSIWERSSFYYKKLPKFLNGQLDIQSSLENLFTIFPEWALDILNVKDMPHEEGKTDFTNKTIIIREDVWKDLNNGDPRARFTACHELGHLVLHANQNIGMSRSDSHPIYRDSEWQADVFAGSVLMPAFIIRKDLELCKNKYEVFNYMGETIERYGISSQAQQITWDAYASRKMIPSSTELNEHFIQKFECLKTKF